MAVRSAAWHVPESSLDVPELPELASLGESERRTCLALGIESVRADDSLNPAALGELAAREALERAGLPARDLGGLIVVEPRAPETLLSSEATRLQHLLGAERAVTFSVGGLGCVSITPALLAARGLLCADRDLGDVLVVHGSKPAGPGRYRHPVTVNGDGGQALLLSACAPGRHGGPDAAVPRDAGAGSMGTSSAPVPVRLLDIVQETNGEHWDLFHVEYRDRPTGEWREACRDTTTYSFRLAMESRSRLSGLLEGLLERNGLKPGDVRGYVSQNLSAAGFTFTEESLGIRLMEVCRDNLRRLGHLGPNDVFLNLYTAIERGELSEGDHAVLINVSPVAAWSVLLVGIGTHAETGAHAQ
ncbi:3-oxoacyl-[acyl-carrier-protein] synthase III C-terminal domain-containing protein [Streptomyces marispadix]|uniref:3-oxoacyl-ACP synthase n=1 Tax=Streptomyces marispadix TaxID=2922868 RepID=A0ABS9T5Y0_9ACTN|nr:3-oxoacyl-[acyl-carrier-protein] synthase III C-terminal domain-containing protein [Streptomyces marispadix]MCH6163951.1 3-oxoacyl-ACP synthase [Streptomyces marispadix]